VSGFLFISKSLHDFRQLYAITIKYFSIFSSRPISLEGYNSFEVALKKSLQKGSGSSELREARNRGRGLIAAVFLFSMFVNMLLLTGPLFMMQVYDRVLGSRSEATLVALFMLVGFLFAVMGILDYVRGRLLARAGNRFRDAIEERCWDAVLDRTQDGKTDRVGATAMQDLDAISKLYASPVLLSLCDIPWTPVFIGAIYIFHPTLGLLALGGGLFILLLTVLNQIFSKRLQAEATQLSVLAQRSADQAKEESDLVRGLGMRSSLYRRWKARSGKASTALAIAGDRTGIFSTLSKTFRMFLQSAMLALGAWQVLQGEMTGGAMIAGSILMGRALAPIDGSISQWPVLQRARLAWVQLADLFEKSPQKGPTTELPRPIGNLDVVGLTIIPPGARTPTLRNVTFNLPPGKALGLIGGSGSGKSTIARAVTGVWPVAAGTIRLDGATLDQYDSDRLGAIMGYLPQRVVLFDGTISENIARMAINPDPIKVIEAAKNAQAHDLILNLPNGYDTQVSAGDTLLSGGQIQRIGLARALYGDPSLVVLDEPNSNLDETGSEAVNRAVIGIKRRGGSVIIIAHRPSAIACCEALLHIEGGIVRAFGSRDSILKSQVANHDKMSNPTQTTKPSEVPVKPKDLKSVLAGKAAKKTPTGDPK